MATPWETVQQQLSAAPRRWLVTGAAGFIGSHLVECLLRLNQHVVGLDNFATGRPANLDEVRAALPAGQWARFQLQQGDICEPADCRRACADVELVLHQAALGSVPWSLQDPLRTHASSVTGFLNMLVAARDAGARRFVYASSSAVYGDSVELPKREDHIGQPLSPYAAAKWMDEIYAGTFARAYGMATVGLRYFNVFGPRQDPRSAYSAVMPRWVAALVRTEPVFINGDGHTSRDFCYVANVVQANVRAALTDNPAALNQIYNVAVGERTSLNELFTALKAELETRGVAVAGAQPTHQEFRAGDVRHSLADIAKARRLLGYEPAFNLAAGLKPAMDWYLKNLR